MCLSFFTLSFFYDTEIRKQAAKKENTGNKQPCAVVCGSEQKKGEMHKNEEH